MKKSFFILVLSVMLAVPFGAFAKKLRHVCIVNMCGQNIKVVQHSKKTLGPGKMKEFLPTAESGSINFYKSTKQTFGGLVIASATAGQTYNIACNADGLPTQATLTTATCSK